MQSKGRSRLFIPIILVLLICAAAFSLTLHPSSVKAASQHRQPTPTPTLGVTPTATPTSGITPTATTITGTSCQVTYTIQNQFNFGFTTGITVANTGSTAINGWTLQFAFPNGQVITSLFNAGYTQVGADVTMTNRSYNGTIPPGGTVITPLGFVATWNNVTNNPPASFTLNGTTCSIG